MTIANQLCVLRLVLCAPLLYLAHAGYPRLFIGVLLFAFFLDVIDGPIARWRDQLSSLGALLDSWADFALYMTLGLGAWWLWPDIIEREWIYVAMMLGSVVIPPFIGFIKFRQITSYHTWLTKFAVVISVPSLLLLFLEIEAWPFRIAAFVCLLAAIEEILITLVLKSARSDIRGLRQALKQR